MKVEVKGTDQISLKAACDIAKTLAISSFSSSFILSRILQTEETPQGEAWNLDIPFVPASCCDRGRSCSESAKQ